MVRKLLGVCLAVLGVILAIASTIGMMGRVKLAVVDAIIAKLICSFVLAAGTAMFVFGKRLLAESAFELTARDPRAPLLLLRSFRDDFVPIGEPDRAVSYAWQIEKQGRTFETMLVDHFSLYGPVIAIGRPGETVPPLGAGRQWVSHADWQDRVKELLQGCRAVLMIVGETKGADGTKEADGLAWEIRRLAELEPAKVIFVMPPLGEAALAERWSRYIPLWPNGVLPPYEPDCLFVAPAWDGRFYSWQGNKNDRSESRYMEAALRLVRDNQSLACAPPRPPRLRRAFRAGIAGLCLGIPAGLGIGLRDGLWDGLLAGALAAAIGACLGAFTSD